MISLLQTFLQSHKHHLTNAMGSSSAPAIFERFSSAVHYISNKHMGIQHMFHILDDFFILGPPNSNICQQNLSRFLRFCGHEGIPIKSEKTYSAATTLSYIGLEIDSIRIGAHLSESKLDKLRKELRFVKRTIALKSRSLLGYLIFCCKVVTPGRCFLRRLLDLTSKSH